MVARNTRSSRVNSPRDRLISFAALRTECSVFPATGFWPASKSSLQIMAAPTTAGLPVTYVDFEDFGIDRHAIGPAINECEALGLIEVTERGRSGNAEFRTPSLYRLTYRYTDKAGPSDEWRRYDTIEQAKAVATVARQSSVERSRRKRGHRMPPPLREAS